MLECRGFDVAVCAGLGIRSVYTRTPSDLFKTIFGCRFGSAGVLVMEVEELQS